MCARLNDTHTHTQRTQGEEGHAFFIVESGQLAAYKDSGAAPVMAYGPGDYFGELALLRADSKRAATVCACLCYVLYAAGSVTD